MENMTSIKIPSLAFMRELDANWQKLFASLSDLPGLNSAPAIHISTMYANLITDGGIMTSFQYC